jgi:hypothetical protein
MQLGLAIMHVNVYKGGVIVYKGGVMCKAI